MSQVYEGNLIIHGETGIRFSKDGHHRYRACGEDEGVKERFRFRVQMDRLLLALAARAINSSRGHVTAMGGAIECRLVATFSEGIPPIPNEGADA